MHKAFFILPLLVGVLSTAHGADELQLSFEAEDEAVKDTTNQRFQSVATQGKDKNLDFSSIYSKIELDALPNQVRQPAVGTRGYRPNLVIVGVGERTPGVGVILEYNHNRLGMGIASSARKDHDNWQNFTSLFATYRFLPFQVSPYLLMGGGLATRPGGVGVLMGAGVEAQAYYGLTFLVGYTYYSAVERGFPGGGIAWGF